MSSLTAIFGSGADKEQDSEKLMELYWNRAELKKDFAEMRKEQHRLQDRIRQQEGRTARVKQQLDHLEGLLTDPAWAHNVVVHFQLRGLARQCSEKLASFAEQLKQQREKKQYANVLDDWNARLAAEVREMQSLILNKQESIHDMENELQTERSRLASMSAFLRFFRGRSTMRTIDRLAELIELAQADEKSLGEEIDAIRGREPPDVQGLDTATKRSINVMIFAFAQQMYAHFKQDNLAEMIHEAGVKSVGAVKYGSRDDCLDLLKRMKKSVDDMDQNAVFATSLQQRAKLIGEKARFAGRDRRCSGETVRSDVISTGRRR